MSNALQTKTALEKKLQLVVAGVQQYVPAGTSLALNGQAVPVAQVVAELNQGIAGYARVRATKNAWQLEVAALKAQEVVLRALVASIKAWAEVTLGKGSPFLAAMGFTPKVKSVPTAQAKAVASARAAQTRAARHILGKKQRAAIVAGVKPTVVVTGIAEAGAVTPSEPGSAVGSAPPNGSTPKGS